MEFEGATPADLAVLQSQLDAAREAEPDYFKPDNDPEPQAIGESDENPGAEQPKAEDNAAAPSAGTSEDTENAERGTRNAEEKKPEATAADAAKTAEPQKPDPNAKPLSKFAKNAERLEKTWKGVNESKAAIAAERAEIEAQKAQFAKERQEWENKQTEKPQHSPEEYEAAAAHWEKQGLLDQADAARAEAKRLRENPPKARTPSAVAAELEAGQRKSWQQVKAEIPEMFEAASPLNIEMKGWLEKNGATHPVMKLAEGPHLIAHFLKMQSELAKAGQVSSRVPVLEKELAALTARNKELEQLVSVSGAGPASAASMRPKRFEDMSDEEQETHLKAMARAAN